MGIEKMMLVNIAGQVNKLDLVISKCIKSKCFHLENVYSTISQMEVDVYQLNEKNPYRESLKKMMSIDFSEKFEFNEVDFSEINSKSLEEIDKYISNLELSLYTTNEQIKQLKESISQYKQILIQLEHIQNMDINLESLFRCKHIHIRFGKLPANSYPKLEYYDKSNFIFVHYDNDMDYYWGVYFAPKNFLKQADKIFGDLYFDRIWVPDYVSGKPEEEINEIRENLCKAEKKLEMLLNDRSEYLKSENKMINMIFCKIKYLYDSFEIRGYATIYKDKFLMVGFIAERDKKLFLSLFDDLPSVSIIIKPPDSENKIKIPVKLRNNPFVKPFSMFVEMYGLPEYNGFNPTNLVAITYTILFGIMFGDVGHGIVLSLLGAIVYKKTKNQLAAIVTRVGVSSAFFGLIFGSIFGFEHALDPLYHAIGLKHKPLEVMDNINNILVGAIGIGAVMIVISILINIVISFKKKNFTEAIFSNNGIFGLMFFCSLVYGIVSLMLLKTNVFKLPFILVFLVIPVLMMFLREPLGHLVKGEKFKIEGIGDFIASNFFEVFEFLLGYATNTLSFLRVGGFVFLHAGMMSVVMLLSETAAKGVSPIIIIIGNIFVMAMEGLIVGIQVLRLEFYEIFSRCYDGDGKAFSPIKVHYNSEVK